MKKYFWMIAGVVLTSSLILMTGCDDDDSSSDGSPVGTWKAHKVITVNLEGVRKETKMDEGWEEIATFGEDGSWSFSYNYNDTTGSGSGYYTDDGDVIVINGRDSTAYDVKGKYMTWPGAVPNGTYEIIWKKQ